PFAVPAFADDALIAHDDAADAGIGMVGVAPERSELERVAHHAPIERGESAHFFLPPSCPDQSASCPSAASRLRRCRMRSISSRNASTSWKLRYTEAKRT